MCLNKSEKQQKDQPVGYMMAIIWCTPPQDQHLYELPLVLLCTTMKSDHLVCLWLQQEFNFTMNEHQQIGEEVESTVDSQMDGAPCNLRTREFYTDQR